MSTPSTDSIAKVKDNLKRIQEFNDYIYNNGGSYIANCYLLLTAQDSKDPGLQIGIDLLEGAFGVVGSFGAFGGFAACFMCAEVSAWTTDTPPNLNSTFANMETRFQKSSMAFDYKCALYSSDPATYWSKTFTWNGQTITLGDLASIDFPTESDPQFFPMAEASLEALDQTIWKTVLRENCWLTLWLTKGAPEKLYVDDIVAWDENFIALHPAYYCTWAWHQKSGFFDSSYWSVKEWNLNFGASRYKANSIPDAACDYLFTDSSNGHIINPEGLVSRLDVFEKWDIRTQTISE